MASMTRLLRVSLLLTLYILVINSQILPSVNFRPSRPVLPRRDCFRQHPNNGRQILYISDQETKCMYWQCTASRLVARQCALQTFIAEHYEGSDYNPCTERHSNLSLQFDCTRKGFDPDGTPSCLKLHEERNTCKDGAMIMYEGNLCWCECAPGVRGDHCIQRTRGQPQGNVEPNSSSLLNSQTNSNRTFEDTDDEDDDNTESELRQRQQLLPSKEQAPVNDDDDTGPVIPDGFGHLTHPSRKIIILDDETDSTVRDSPPPDVERAEDSVNLPLSLTPAAARAPVAQVAADGRFMHGDPCPKGSQRDFCSEQNGCLNGGTCVNQCLQAVCLCKAPYTAGRRCEQYRCTFDVECMNNGKCSRGISGISPVATCECLPGYSGAMCEIIEQQQTIDDDDDDDDS